MALIDFSEFNLPKIDETNFENNPYVAKWYHKRIYSLVYHLESQLKKDENLIAEVFLNDGSKIKVESFGFFNPDIVSIVGTNDANETIMVLINQSHIQTVFTIKKNSANKKIKIGFHSEIED